MASGGIRGLCSPGKIWHPPPLPSTRPPSTDERDCSMCHGKTDYTHPLRPFGITGLNDAEDEMARAIWIEPDGKFMVHPRRFIDCIRKATTKAGRCVFIGSDKASRAPSRLGKVVSEKPRR